MAWFMACFGYAKADITMLMSYGFRERKADWAADCPRTDDMAASKGDTWHKACARCVVESVSGTSTHVLTRGEEGLMAHRHVACVELPMVTIPPAKDRLANKEDDCGAGFSIRSLEARIPDFEISDDA